MQKLSTVFWLFICVKLLCKIERKWEKKIRETTASFVFIFGLKKKTSVISRRRKFVKKAYCFDFSVCLKNKCKSKKKPTKNSWKHSSLCFDFFGMTEKPVKKLWKWGNLDSFLCLELSSNWHQLQVGPLYFCFAFYITANIKRIIAKNKCTFFSTTKKKLWNSSRVLSLKFIFSKKTTKMMRTPSFCLIKIFFHLLE